MWSYRNQKHVHHGGKSKLREIEYWLWFSVLSYLAFFCNPRANKRVPFAGIGMTRSGRMSGAMLMFDVSSRHYPFRRVCFCISAANFRSPCLCSAKKESQAEHSTREIEREKEKEMTFSWGADWCIQLRLDLRHIGGTPCNVNARTYASWVRVSTCWLSNPIGQSR